MPLEEVKTAAQANPAAVVDDKNADPAAAQAAADAAKAAEAAAIAAAAKAAESKTPPAAPVVPEKYDLKLPEGSTLDAKSVENIASFAKERGLSNEQAQAILQRDHERQLSFDQANKPGTGDEWKSRVQGFEKAALADKEIGGSEDALKANAEFGRRAIAKFFPETMQKFLHDSGLGSHPDVIRGFSKIGRAMADDVHDRAGAGGLTGEKKDMASILYDNTPKE